MEECLALNQKVGGSNPSIPVMIYYEEKTGEPFKTTAIYPNRIKDKIELESICDLREEGKSNILFLTKDGRIPLAQGYIRIVYGDHGPYIELLYDNIFWKCWSLERYGIGYYDIWKPVGSEYDIVLYDQRKIVSNLKNPPKGPKSFKGNRKEGYADYRVGRLYLNPYDLLMRHTNGTSSIT